MKVRQGILCALMFCFAIAGCGYHLAGHSSALPPHIRTIAIPVFENRSSQPNIHRELTSIIRRKFITDGRLKVVDRRKADLLLSGSLVSYDLRVVAFSGTDAASGYIVQLGVQVKAVDRVKRRMFLKQQNFTTKWDYQTTSDVIDSETARFAALEEAYEDLADRLVSIIVEQF